MKRCAHCNNSLGLISHRHWSLRFCSLAHKKAYLHKLQQRADEEDCADVSGVSKSYAQRVLAFHIRRVQDEYQWIATWLEEMQTTR